MEGPHGVVWVDVYVCEKERKEDERKKERKMRVAHLSKYIELAYRAEEKDAAGRKVKQSLCSFVPRFMMLV